MRSSVSVILSNPPPDITMSYPDYSAHPHHHHSLLILIKQVGTQLQNRHFHRLYERISRVAHIKVVDSVGGTRPVWITYKREYPIENNDWGDFQAYRRVIGIISIGRVDSQSELNSICKEHESLKVKYSSTLYDSRAIILGLNSDGTIHRNRRKEEEVVSASSTKNTTTRPSSLEKVPPASSVVDRDSGVYVTPPATATTSTSSGSGQAFLQSGGSRSSSDSGSECAAAPPSPSPRSSSSSASSSCESGGEEDEASVGEDGEMDSLPLQLPTCFKTRALFYPTPEHAVNIENQIHDFICSLFWVLEYKRTEKTQEKLDRPQLLCAPFERKDLIGLDLDSRTNKKKCIGRMKKHLADLSLQVGLTTDALAQYTQAVDILKGCNDWLWLAACYEGLCSASVMILYPQLSRRNNLVQRNSSLGVGGEASGCGGCLESKSSKGLGSSGSNSLPMGLDPSAPKQISKYCLTADDIVEKYKEAIVHYSKYRNAGVIETEASLKAVHVLIELHRFLLAAEFLSNVVFINLQLSDEEKIIRFNALSEMYNQIGFHRKASFFRRVAAMRCVAPQNQEPDWSRCYRLLLLTLDGYRLSLDAALFIRDGRPGWPALQIQILQELVGTSRRMGEHGLCTRHQAFLLSAMLSHLNAQERQDTFSMLEAISSKGVSVSGFASVATAPLVVPGTAVIIPPVNFNNIPFCRYVRIMPLPKERVVHLKEESKTNDSYGGNNGPFIFSPFQSIVTTAKVAGKADCEWVEGDVCEVVLGLCNTLPFQIKLNQMTLITEGVEFEPWTSTIVLDPHSEPQVVSLRGRPQEPGELRILGYSFVLAGVASLCRFKSFSHLRVPFYSLTVVPAIPCVQIFCDSSSSGTGLVSDGGLEGGNKVCLTLNAGETHECSIVIHNVSSQPVEKIEVTLDYSARDEYEKIFEFSLENLEAQLPIAPGGRASLTLYIYAASDFLFPGYSLEEEAVSNVVVGSETPSLISVAPSTSSSSLPSRQSTIMSSLRGQAKTKRALSTTSNASSSVSGSSGSALATSLGTVGISNHTLEGCVKLNYTGGQGMESKYWRMCDVAVSVEVLPSLLVTRWDALPAERPNQCYLVLDLLNASNHEMDLQYTPCKRILIQGGESCRVPVPIDRCPFTKKYSEKDKDKDNNEGLEPWQRETLGDDLASSIELHWTLGPSESPGKASLRSLTFPPQTRHLIAMAPIHWEVKLNDRGIDNGTENVGVAGELQRLSVGISNATSDILPPLTVAVTSFQDHQNGSYTYRLEGKMATTGATKFVIPQLNPDQAFYHECGLVFFNTGVFKVEVSSSPFSDSCSGSGLSQDALCRTWKLAPPIEITILSS